MIDMETRGYPTTERGFRVCPLGTVFPTVPPEPSGPDDDHAPVATPLPLEGLPGGGELDGRFVRVESAGRVRLPDGTLAPIPAACMDANGNFAHRPRRGGTSPARNERDGGRHGHRVVEAAGFGQVNAYYHTHRLASYVNGLIEELDLPPLPRVRVLVGTHDGYDATGRFAPGRVLAGGHYRMTARRYDPEEDTPVAPEGEVHLGPGRFYLKWGEQSAPGRSRTRRLAGRPYLHQPAHNPAIVYHEYGHHVARHTADFRCNRQRRPDRQSNRKSWLDEGICDYFTAVMLGHGQVFAWHRAGLPPTHPRCRSLAPGRPLSAFDATPHADPHYNGTIWATYLWRLRHALIEREGLAGRDADRLVLHTLVRVGRTGDPNPAKGRDVRRANLQSRNRLATVLACLDCTLTDHGVRARLPIA